MSAAMRSPRTAGEYRLLVRVLLVLVLVRLLLPCVRMKRLVRWVGRSHPSRPPLRPGARVSSLSPVQREPLRDENSPPALSLRATTRPPASRVPARAPVPVSLQTIAWYTDALLQRMPAGRLGNCLPRSLTLFFFATRAGLPVRFHCGVRRVGEALEGHAWLTLGDQLFLERGDPEGRYAVIFSYPEPSSGETPGEALAYQGGSG